MNKILINRQRTSQDGFIMASMVWIVLIMTAIALSIATLATNQFSRTSKAVAATNSLLVAEAGAEASLYELNQDDDFSGYSSEQTFYSDSVKGGATYETAVTAGSVSNEKIIISTGRVYIPASNTTPQQVRKVRLTVVGTTTDNFSVQTGPGGLLLSNSATISNGDVRVNGYLDMSNSARIGSATNTVNVYVAHVNCPSGGGATYPAQCTSGQPITINNTAHIYGEVRATNQTNGAGMSDPGLVAGSSAESVALPTHDRDAQKNAVTSTMTGSAASCSHSETKTYAAHTHITGNVSIRNSCQVTINGDVWVDGSFTMSNTSSIKVGSSLTSPPTIMVDGASADFSNSAAILANANNIGFKFVTYRSAASCSPDCTDVTGTDLYNSRNTRTISINNSSLAAGSEFYARWSKVTVSNGGSIGSIIGQTVELNNTGNISFGTDLSSGQSVWSIKNYQQVFE